MSYKKVKPVPVNKMMNERYNGHFSICQKLREIYQKTDDEEIKLNCRIAMAMAKKMQDRLKYYKRQQDV